MRGIFHHIEPVQDHTFQPCAVELDEYFEDIIGVSKPPEQPSIPISIRVYRSLWPYIDSKPIHPSQAVTAQTDDWVAIRLDLIPNYELYAVMLGYGDQVEILAPEEVRAEIKQRIADVQRRYDVY